MNLWKEIVTLSLVVMAHVLGMSKAIFMTQSLLLHLMYCYIMYEHIIIVIVMDTILYIMIGVGDSKDKTLI